MKYKLRKNNNPSQKSYGRFFAKALHYNTVTADQLEKEIERNCSATVADCKLVLCELADTLVRHLQAGDKVELPFIGTAKLEIISASVADEDGFDPRKHIKGVKVHVLPTSHHGVQEMYHAIHFSRENTGKSTK